MTVSLLIGNTDNKLTQQEWAAFISDVHEVVDEFSSTINFNGGSSFNSQRQNACWVFQPLQDPDRDSNVMMLAKLIEVKEQYRQDSIALIIAETVFI